MLVTNTGATWVDASPTWAPAESAGCRPPLTAVGSAAAGSEIWTSETEQGLIGKISYPVPYPNPDAALASYRLADLPLLARAWERGR